MSLNLNVYELLVDNLGEATAFEICEKLGGIELTIPTKAHKTFRVRKLVERHGDVLECEKKRIVFVKTFARELEISRSAIYKIIKEIRVNG